VGARFFAHVQTGPNKLNTWSCIILQLVQRNIGIEFAGKFPPFITPFFLQSVFVYSGFKDISRFITNPRTPFSLRCSLCGEASRRHTKRDREKASHLSRLWAKVTEENRIILWKVYEINLSELVTEIFYASFGSLCETGLLSLLIS
jgi:hypothetical protein